MLYLSVRWLGVLPNPRLAGGGGGSSSPSDLEPASPALLFAAVVDEFSVGGVRFIELSVSAINCVS